ncbi:MAG: NYN domain-containing protein [Planctomycetota bacterium]|nr:NYN domain-containing protein [Planctomycetota bacterium]
MRIRTICLIDGFNFYHAIVRQHRNFACFKWCNYRRLAENFLETNDDLQRVIWFTASAYWDIGKVARHSALVKAQPEFGVEIVSGKFKKRTIHCPKCDKNYRPYKEKESDINLAISLVSNAYENSFDKALLITGDSDFVPAMKLVKSKFPAKQIGVIFADSPKNATELREGADFWRVITREHLVAAQLPDEIQLANGKTLNRPPEYRCHTPALFAPRHSD